MTATRVGELSPPVARRRVGRQLRSMRAKARLTLDEAAPLLDLARSSLHRVEAGMSGVSVHLVRSMMDLYDQYTPDLLDTARATRRRGWWRAFNIADPEYAAWETSASHLWELAVVRVPDLLQTEEYARALLRGSADLDAELAVRRIRQSRMDEGMSVSAVLDEAALRNMVDGPSVMRAQLAHLAECSSRPAVTLRVLPADAGAAVRVGGFRLLGYDHPDDLPVLYLESALGVLREEGAEQVAAVRQLFDSISSAALSREESRTFIEQLAN